MAYNLTEFKKRLGEIETRLKEEQQSIRTGRANPSILESVWVNAHEAKLSLKQLTSITIEGVRSLRLEPWDKSQIKAIETAIINANLGLSTTVDGAGIRVIFPELTSESREKLAKIVRGQLEESRVALRQSRDKVWSEIQSLEKKGELSEDDKFRAKEELQKLVDECNKKLEALTEKKEQEIAN